MRSMTGFGRTQLERGGTQVVAEVRSLNQRFFELKLNLPRGWGEHEGEIRKIVQAAVERGRVEAFIRCVVLKPPPRGCGSTTSWLQAMSPSCAAWASGSNSTASSGSKRFCSAPRFSR